VAPQSESEPAETLGGESVEEDEFDSPPHEESDSPPHDESEPEDPPRTTAKRRNVDGEFESPADNQCDDSESPDADDV
jgi:hypothetical protein